MDVNSKRTVLRGGLSVLLPGLLLLCGCTARQANDRPVAIEQQVANARSRADYEKVAVWYEQEAAAALEMARRHHRMLADIYRPAYGSPYAGPYRNPGFVRHCADLAREYEEAAEQSSALAKLYRQLAAEAKW
jgi:hypothetical protein